MCNGHDARYSLSLARTEGWEEGLGTHRDELRGLRVAVVADWGGATVSPVMWELLDEAAGQLIADCGLVRVDGRRHEASPYGRGVVDQRDDRDCLGAR